MPAIQSLYSSVDFIGISSYTSLSPGFTINQIEGATYQYAQEMKSFGVDIADLILNKVPPALQVLSTSSLSPELFTQALSTAGHCPTL